MDRPLLCLILFGTLLAGCPTADASLERAQGRLVLRGGTVLGLGAADVEVVDGRIARVGQVPELPDEQAVDVDGRWLVPAFIDSHVHLAYLPAQAEMADGGIAGAVDQAAPLAFLEQGGGALDLKLAGPMITAELGYPTQGWGAHGYGLQCADAPTARSRVAEVAERGASLIKLPLTTGPSLSPEAFAAAADEAHARGLRVSTHALSAALAERAAVGGADVLAHTPTEPLPSEVVGLWSERAVVSTLRAFGGSAAARANLGALAEAGATVLYGTDFGNTRDAGIDRIELDLMRAAGLSPQQIIASATSVPAQFWGFENLGSIEVGKDASLLVLGGDPLQDLSKLSEPERVFLRGLQR